ncbi:MAG: hypothetical protein AB7I37_00085 [Pirellulales bacterium]
MKARLLSWLGLSDEAKLARQTDDLRGRLIRSEAALATARGELAELRTVDARNRQERDEARADLRVAQSENAGLWKLVARYHATWDKDTAVQQRGRAMAEAASAAVDED